MWSLKWSFGVNCWWILWRKWCEGFFLLCFGSLGLWVSSGIRCLYWRRMIYIFWKYVGVRIWNIVVFMIVLVSNGVLLMFFFCMRRFWGVLLCVWWNGLVLDFDFCLSIGGIYFKFVLMVVCYVCGWCWWLCEIVLVKFLIFMLFISIVCLCVIFW